MIDLFEPGTANQLTSDQAERASFDNAFTPGVGSTAHPLSRNLTLNALIAASATWDRQFAEIPLTVDDLRFNATGILGGDHLHPMNQGNRTRLFNTIGAPGRYFEKHSAEFQATALTAHAARGDFGSKPTLVLRNGQLMTIARGDLFRLPNSDVIRSVQDALGDDSGRLSVTRIGSDPEVLDIELVSPSKAITIRSGDVVQSGLHIVHDRFGNQATLIEAFIYRLVCQNGMVQRECAGDGKARTRKLPVDFPNNRELQMNQIRRLTEHNWKGLQVRLEALKGTTLRPARVEELFISWLRRARISVDNMMPRLLTAWRREGAEDTYYGAVNGLTRVATHDLGLSERQRRVLASLAGLLAFSDVHLCERCFSILAGSASEHAAS